MQLFSGRDSAFSLGSQLTCLDEPLQFVVCDKQDWQILTFANDPHDGRHEPNENTDEQKQTIERNCKHCHTDVYRDAEQSKQNWLRGRTYRSDPAADGKYHTFGGRYFSSNFFNASG